MKANAATAKSSGHQTSNATNQALLEAKNDFKLVIDSFITEFKQAFNQEPVCQQASCTSDEQTLHAIIKDLREQNKKMKQMITKLASCKENVPPKRPSNQQRTWC